MSQTAGIATIWSLKADNLSSEKGEITIIFAPPRKGKTVLMTHFLNEIAYNCERIKKMQKEVLNKQLNGFNVSIPEHCASSNYDIEFRKFGYSRRYNTFL